MHFSEFLGYQKHAINIFLRQTDSRSLQIIQQLGRIQLLSLRWGRKEKEIEEEAWKLFDLRVGDKENWWVIYTKFFFFFFFK